MAKNINPAQAFAIEQNQAINERRARRQDENDRQRATQVKHSEVVQPKRGR